MMDSKQLSDSRPIIYWVATAIVALLFVVPGASLVAHVPHLLEEMGRLGYPPYFLYLLGACKVLGAVAILVPGLPRLKEWAYAGMLFDILGAIVSHAAVGDEAANMVLPIVIACMLVASWALRPTSRTLQAMGSMDLDPPNTRALERRV